MLKETQEKQYLVRWEIDIWAKDPREAAEKALIIQRDLGSIAQVFSVFGGGQYVTQVDLIKQEI